MCDCSPKNQPHFSLLFVKYVIHSRLWCEPIVLFWLLSDANPLFVAHVVLFETRWNFLEWRELWMCPWF